MSARSCRTWLAALTSLVLLGLATTDSANAQDRRRNKTDRAGAQQHDAARRRPPRDGPKRGGGRRENHRGSDRGPRMPRFLAEALPVRPSEADRGPLQPGEARELLQFARRNVPPVAQSLNRLRRRDAAAFRRKLQEVAPRLRHLRRVFDYDDELGRMVVQHTENMQRIHRAVRMWHNREKKPVDRRRIAEAVRGWVAQNLRIEARVVERNAADLESRRDAIIAERVRALSDPGYDLMGEPLEIREAAEALWDATGAEEQAAGAARLGELVSRQLDDRIMHMRNRVERIRAGGRDEVDRRVRRLLRDRPGRP